ncbi:MAG: putative quinol monooxygenase [Alphaproteobacteria bacterium]
MGEFAIWVVFELEPNAFDPFHDLVVENARTSLRDEPGCRRFDVLVPDGDARDRVALYEIYDDEAAFQAHLEAPHFQRFDAAVRHLVRERRIERYALQS